MNKQKRLLFGVVLTLALFIVHALMRRRQRDGDDTTETTSKPPEKVRHHSPFVDLDVTTSDSTNPDPISPLLSYTPQPPTLDSSAPIISGADLTALQHTLELLSFADVDSMTQSILPVPSIEEIPFVTPMEETTFFDADKPVSTYHKYEPRVHFVGESNQMKYVFLYLVFFFFLIIVFSSPSHKTSFFLSACLSRYMRTATFMVDSEEPEIGGREHFVGEASFGDGMTVKLHVSTPPGDSFWYVTLKDTIRKTKSGENKTPVVAYTDCSANPWEEKGKSCRWMVHEGPNIGWRKSTTLKLQLVL